MNLREEINRCFALFDQGDLAAAKRGYLAYLDAIKDKSRRLRLNLLRC